MNQTGSEKERREKATPRVSVIVPAYNHERYVGEAIDSVLEQSFGDFELIVVDDGSTDGTWQVVESYGDPRLRAFAHDNCGTARTLNRGIELARGEFVSILNSDDRYRPERLARFVSLMEDKPDCMIAASLIRPIDDRGDVVEPGSRGSYWLDWYQKSVASLKAEADPFASMLRHNFVATTSNIFMRSRYFEENRPFDPLLAYCNDYEFLLRVLRIHPFAMIDEPLLDYRIHERNTIKENEFLKHLEVLHSVFSNVDLDELLARHSLRERMSFPLFRILFDNPEINPEKFHSDYMAVVRKKEDEIDEIRSIVAGLHGEVEKREQKLREADEWLKNLNSEVVKHKTEVEERGKKLAMADEWLKNFRLEIQDREAKLSNAQDWLEKMKDEAEVYLRKLSENASELEARKRKILDIGHELELNKRKMVDIEGALEHRNRKIVNMERELGHRKDKIIEIGLALNEKNATLQEIYNSKGWLWLTRYRNLKHRIDRVVGRLKRPFGGETSRRCGKPGLDRTLKDFLMEGPRRLFFYRKAQALLKAPPRGDCRTVDSPAEKERAGTQHIEIIHPIRPQRPVVVHAIANFMTGGSSRLVADLVEHLGHRYDQEVATFYNPDPPAFSGFPIRVFPRSASSILSFLEEKKAALLHVHYWGECDDPWYRRVFEAARKKGCVVVENINTPVEPYFDEVVDHYVYVSEYARAFGSRVPESSSVIYPGSDLEMFKRNGTPVPDDVIGMVYRLENDKLSEDSIRVFIDVVRQRPRTKAIVVGGGSFLAPYMKQVADAGVAKNFVFTDCVPYGDLPGYYRRFSVFVAPVKKESFGQVSPFAMGMELPVAGYDIGALPEILDGRECLGTDRKQLADIIARLLDDREKRLEIGEKNRKRAFEHFTVEAMIRQYDLLYERLLNKSNE